MSDFSAEVNNLRNSFKEGVTKPIKWRVAQLKALDRMLVENEDKFIEALKQDLNKPVQDTVMAEIEFVKNDIISLLRNIDKWAANQPVSKSLVTLLDKPYIHPEPYGVVLIIGAWNFPLQLCLAPLTPAIAAGNCAVVKPSEIAPATAKVLEDLFPKYMDSKCIKVINGGVPETTELLKQKFDYIFYTGSTMVGKIIASAASKHLTPCTLELGGKSPAFVDGCANLEMAAKRLLWGKFNNAGQICVAPDYVLCTQETQDKLLPVMKKVLNEWYTEKPEQSDFYCRIVSKRHAERLNTMLENTKGKIELGGQVDIDSKFFAPTVVTGVDLEDSTMQEEIFGPILPMITLKGVDEAIEIINSRDKPLAMYVFTEKDSVVKKLRDNTSSGGFTVNDTIFQLAVEELPFGGVGASGMGSYHGKAGFDTFTHYKPVLEKDLSWIGEKMAFFRYPPYDAKNISLIKALLKNREMPSVPAFLRYLFVMALGAVIGFVCTKYIK
eukprot:TRINITY_DN6416_c0_g1_i1.p1 TRINITY_DN6416_c0_g1~~TRINITY_DN6416_c0_g1_i1.p1  ORF type:complete len:496 (+),score=129.72 TRINITY_DN6416_c0_g1_i1:51-1538(+)